MPSTVVVGVGNLKPRSLASFTRVALPLACGLNDLNFPRPGDQRISHQTDVRVFLDVSTARCY